MTATEAPPRLLVEARLRRGDVRAALLATVPHAPSDPDHLSSRIRLAFVDAETLVVSACDGTTGGLARVTVSGIDAMSGALPTFDLPLDSVKDLLAVFKPPSNADARQAWNDEDLRLELTDRDTTWTESGAFVDGKALTVARLAPLPDDETAYPDLPAVLGHYIAAAHRVDHDVTVNPNLLARFVAAAKAYAGDTVIWRHVYAPRGLVVHIGRAYIGLLLTIHDDTTEEQAKRNRDRMAETLDVWAVRLRALARTDEAARRTRSRAPIVDLRTLNGVLTVDDLRDLTEENPDA